MQKDPLISFLGGALCLAALGVFLLTLACEWRFRQLRRLQPAVAQVQQKSALADALANETTEYGRLHPAVNPILQNVGLLPAKPAAK